MAGCSCCQRIMLLSFTGGLTFLYISRGCHPFDGVLKTSQDLRVDRARVSNTPSSARVFHGSSVDTIRSSTLYMFFQTASQSIGACRATTLSLQSDLHAFRTSVKCGCIVDSITAKVPDKLQRCYPTLPCRRDVLSCLTVAENRRTATALNRVVTCNHSWTECNRQDTMK
jgi:hypothetical protein